MCLVCDHALVKGRRPGRPGSVRVEVFGGGGVEEPAELLELVGCAVAALCADRGAGDGGRVEHDVLGVDSDVRNGYENIKVTFHIDADAPKKDIEALVAQSQKRSAVYDLVTNPTNVTVEVV